MGSSMWLPEFSEYFKDTFQSIYFSEVSPSFPFSTQALTPNCLPPSQIITSPGPNGTVALSYSSNRRMMVLAQILYLSALITPLPFV